MLETESVERSTSESPPHISTSPPLSTLSPSLLRAEESPYLSLTQAAQDVVTDYLSNGRHQCLSGKDYLRIKDRLCRRRVHREPSHEAQKYLENASVVGEEVFVNGALLISQKDLVAVLLSIPFSTCRQSFSAAAKASYAGLPDALVKRWFDVRLTHLEREKDPSPPANESSRVISSPSTALSEVLSSPVIPPEDAPLLGLDDNSIKQWFDVRLTHPERDSIPSPPADESSSFLHPPSTVQTEVSFSPIIPPEGAPLLGLHDNSLRDVSISEAVTQFIQVSLSPSSQTITDLSTQNSSPVSSPDYHIEDDLPSSGLSEESFPAPRPDSPHSFQIISQSAACAQIAVPQSLMRSGRLKEGWDFLDSEVEHDAVESTSQSDVFASKHSSSEHATSRLQGNPYPKTYNPIPTPTFDDNLAPVSPTPAAGTLKKQRLLRRGHEGSEAVAGPSVLVPRDAQGQGSTSVRPKRAREVVVADSEEEEEDRSRRKRRCWDGAVSRVCQFVKKPFDFGYWRRRQS